MALPVRCCLLASVLVMLAGCSTQEVLVPKSAVVPAGQDLSGTWRLESETDGDTSRSVGSLVHVFLESGSRLKITQTPDGLFVSFDRAVVEEYRFGENRRVNVGPIEANRVSGWEGGDYVIETLAEKNNKLVERYKLLDGGDRLLRQVTILRNGDTRSIAVQRFNRE